MIRLLHPRPAHGRQKFVGIEFRDGVAEVEQLHPEVEASLFQHGFTIEKTEQIDAPKKKRGRQAPPPDPEDPPRGMTVHAVPLVEIVIDGHDFTVPTNASVQDLRDLVVVSDEYDIWLNDGALDSKVEDGWVPFAGANLRTAPRFINGG